MPNRPISKKPPQSVSRRTALGFLSGVAVGTTNATAGGGAYIHPGDPIIEDIGAAERIRAADTLRTIAQEATATACFLFNGVESDASQKQIAEARTRFRQHYDAILLGNLGMNIIGKEERPKTIASLERVYSSWGPIDKSLGDLLDDPQDQVALNVLTERSADLFRASSDLVSEISGQYANPAELLQHDALILDLAGRQGHLTQAIAAHACAIWGKDSSALAKSALKEAMLTFETSLTALRFGMPEMGMKPAPNDDIAKALDSVIADWFETRDILTNALEANKFSEEMRADLYRRMTSKTRRLEDLTKVYVAYAKHRHEKE